MTVKLIQLSRGQAIIEIDGELFNVNGEGTGDGTWEVFPLMVYERGAGEQWVLIQDAEKRWAIVGALQTCRPDPSRRYPATLRPHCRISRKVSTID